MATMQGPSTQLAAACRQAAASTTGKTGANAYASAATAIALSATPATNRSERAASTSAPPGIWPMSAISPPADRTRPMSIWVHFCEVR